MALIIEDGSGLANADSFVTLDEVRAFANSRGAALSEVDATLEAQVRTAHDYLLAVEGQLSGSRAVAGQALPFPRSGLSLFGAAVPNNVIPQQIKNCVCQLLIEGLSQEVMPSTDGKVILSETVGPLSTTYANTGAAGQNPTMPRVDAWLKPFMRGGGISLTSLRV